MTDASAAESSSLETREEATAIGGEAKFWMGQLALAEADHRDWIKNGKGVVERYKGEKERTAKGNKRFNILFSNVETLKAALFARMAKPDIRRRFADRDAVGRQVAEIVERASIYCDDSYDSDREFEAALEDYLLPGRGIVKVCYEAETTEGDDKKEYVAKQELYDEHVCWDDFRHEPGKKWTKLTWIAFRHLMNRAALRENFENSLGAEEIGKIPLNWTPKADDDKLPDAYKRAEVWEVWDKDTRTRVWVVQGYDSLLRKDPDPYGLEDFFPCAEPLQAITANDTFIPRPEFECYRDQADGLDEIEGRIDRLTRALKRRGVYDATITELKRLAKAADNEFIPVKNYADLTTKGGLAAAFQSEDLSIIAQVLSELHTQRDLRVQTIYEVVGIADIMRGSSDPRETLGAQKIKAQFGGNRLKKRQDKVQKWIRNTLRLKAEIIAEHFEPQKLAEMTGFTWEPIPPQPPMLPGMSGPGMSQPMPSGQPGVMSPTNGMPIGQPGMGGMQPGQGMMPQTGSPPGVQTGLPIETNSQPSVEGKITPEMIAILRNDKLRSYRIDVETDSTVFEDAEAEKTARTELLKSLSEFVTAWMPILQVQPKLLPLAFELLAFGVRGFKAGRQIEESIEQAKLQLEEAAKQPPPPSPEQQKIEADKEAMAVKLQADQQKQLADLQMKQAELELEAQDRAQQLQFEQQKHEQEMQFEREKHQMEMACREREMVMTAHENKSNRMMQAQQHEQQMDMEGQKMASAEGLKREELDRTDGIERERMADAKAGRREGFAAEIMKMQTGAELEGEQESSDQTKEVMAEVSGALKELAGGFKQLAKAQMAGRKIVRGADGKASHTEAVP